MTSGQEHTTAEQSETAGEYSIFDSMNEADRIFDQMHVVAAASQSWIVQEDSSARSRSGSSMNRIAPPRMRRILTIASFLAAKRGDALGNGRTVWGADLVQEP